MSGSRAASVSSSATLPARAAALDSTQARTHAIPSFVLNAPFSLAADHANNASMRKLSDEERRIDRPRAMQQWLRLYRFLASNGMVYLLPSQAHLPEQTYVANLGIVLPHTPEPVAV